MLSELAAIGSMGTAGVAFRWVSSQTRKVGAIGWRSAVLAPSLLIAYSAYTSTSLHAFYRAGTGRGMLSVALALLAGFLFDRKTPFLRDAKMLNGRRSQWPLLLWGSGAASYALAPLAEVLGGWQWYAELLSGAVLLVSSGSLAGQALSWAARIRAGKVAPLPESSRQGLVGGAVCVLAAVGLLVL
jgi:hypothetical protein